MTVEIAEGLEILTDEVDGFKVVIEEKRANGEFTGSGWALYSPGGIRLDAGFEIGVRPADTLDAVKADIKTLTGGDF